MLSELTCRHGALSPGSLCQSSQAVSKWLLWPGLCRDRAGNIQGRQRDALGAKAMPLLSHSCMIAFSTPPPSKAGTENNGVEVGWGRKGVALCRSCSIHADLWMSGESKRMSHNFRSAQPEGSRQPITRGSGWLKHRQRQTQSSRRRPYIHTVTVDSREQVGGNLSSEGKSLHQSVCVHVCQTGSLEAGSKTHTSYFGQSSPREWNLKKKRP